MQKPGCEPSVIEQHLCVENVDEQPQHGGVQHFTRVDGPWSWMVCMFLFSSSLIANGGSSTYGILFPAIDDEFKEGQAITAIPGAIAFANSIMLGPIGGKLCDSFGCRVTMVMGGFICAVGLLASCFTPNIAVLLVSYGIIFGFGVNLVYISSLVILPNYFKKYLLFVTAAVSIGPGAGMLMMSLLVQTFYKTVGWRKTFLCIARVSLVPFLGGGLLRDNRKKPPRRRANNSQCSAPACCTVFRDPLFVLCTAMVSITCLGHAMPPVHLAQHCRNLSFSSDQASWLYFTIGLSSLISRLLCGKLGEKVPLLRIYQFGAFLLALSNLLLPLARDYKYLVLYAVGYGAGEGLMYTPIHCFVLSILPMDVRGQGLGVYLFFSGVSFAVAPSISGLIADKSGSYNSAFYAAGALELVGASLPFLTPIIRKTNNEKSTRTQHELLAKEELFVEQRVTVL